MTINYLFSIFPSLNSIEILYLNDAIEINNIFELVYGILYCLFTLVENKSISIKLVNKVSV